MINYRCLLDAAICVVAAPRSCVRRWIIRGGGGGGGVVIALDRVYTMVVSILRITLRGFC